MVRTIESKEELGVLLEKYLGDTDKGHIQLLWNLYNNPEIDNKDSLGLNIILERMEEDA